MTTGEYNKCVDSYSDNIYRYILKSCRSKELAEDVVQESFLVLWENISDIKLEKAKAYLFTTAYRKMIDYFRREMKNSDIEKIDMNDLHYLPEHYGLQDILNFALEKLPPVQKHLILLRDYENYSYKEIEEITGLKEAQVKVYIFRARKFLKDFIRKPEFVL